MEEDPFFYRKFSVLLQQAIDDYKAQRISEAQYLAKVKDIMEAVRARPHERRAARASGIVISRGVVWRVERSDWRPAPPEDGGFHRGAGLTDQWQWFGTESS